jgi:hypothetical protein
MDVPRSNGAQMTQDDAKVADVDRLRRCPTVSQAAAKQRAMAAGRRREFVD